MALNLTAKNMKKQFTLLGLVLVGLAALAFTNAYHGLFYGVLQDSTFTASRVLVSDGSKNAASSSVTSTTLGFLDATSSIQTQLNSKVPAPAGTMVFGGSATASAIPIMDSTGTNYVKTTATIESNVGIFRGGFRSDGADQYIFRAGDHAGENAPVNAYSSYVGPLSGQYATGINNDFSGYGSGQYVLGNANTFHGWNAGNQAIYGTSNVGEGFGALEFGTNASENIVNGVHAGEYATNMTDCDIGGYFAAQRGYNMARNIIHGQRAAQNAENMTDSIVLGDAAMQNATNAHHVIILGANGGNPTNAHRIWIDPEAPSNDGFWDPFIGGDTTNRTFRIGGSIEATNGIVTSAVLAVDDTFEGMLIPGLNNSGGVTQWDAVYLNSSSQWVKADANGSGTYPARGLAIATASTGNATTIITGGTVRNGGWSWTPGGTLYLSTTAGGLTQSVPATTGDKVQVIGFALTATVIAVQISPDYGTAP